MPPASEAPVKVLLLKEDASIDERIEALEMLRDRLELFASIISKMTEQIALRIEELKSMTERK